MTMLSRTHPVAVAGEIIRYGYDRETDVFQLSFNAGEAGESLIYVHKPFVIPDELDYSIIELYENGASLIGAKTDAGKNSITIQITK